MKKNLMFMAIFVGGIWFLSLPSFAQMNAEKPSMKDSAMDAMTNDEMMDDEMMDADMMMKSPVMNEQKSKTDDQIVNETTNYKDEDVVAEAEAYVKATAEGSKVWGIVDLTETKEGVYVDAEFGNVPNPGKHGVHIHENGSCEDSGNAAGGHFNPEGVKHGYLPDNGHMAAHMGDMGNIDIDEYGDGYLSIFLPGVSLTKGQNNVAGKAVILHEKVDDFGQPTGNAGGRIGCGVIEIIE